MTAANGEEPQCFVRLIITILSALFERTVKQNNELAVSQPQESCPAPVAESFSGRVKPAISIRRYLDRIFRNTNCSSCCYVISFIYIDRFLYLNPSVLLDSFNAHRFLLIAILTAVKVNDRSCYGNAANTHFANVGGISVSEMNEMELDFLFGLRFDLTVKEGQYCGCFSFLQSQINDLNAEVSRILHFVSSEEEEEEEEEEEGIRL